MMDKDIIKEDRPVKPWDLLNTKMGRVSNEIADQRYSICNSCEKLMNFPKVCKECGCFMKLKVTLPQAYCPLEKWGQEEKESEW